MPGFQVYVTLLSSVKLGGLGVICCYFITMPVLGVNADKVGIEAAEMLLANLRHGGTVDEYLQDQV